MKVLLTKGTAVFLYTINDSYVNTVRCDHDIEFNETELECISDKSNRMIYTFIFEKLVLYRQYANGPVDRIHSYSWFAS